MSITVAKSAGFCFGVNRAINIVNSLLDKNVKVSTLGPIIHNMEVVNELESRGCKAVDNIDEVEKDATLVIRSHGVPKYVIDKLDENGVKYEDATCPFVKKIHNIVANPDNKDGIVLIAGNSVHPEVEGIIGHCSTECHTFKNSEEIDEIYNIVLKKNNKQVFVVAQTTFDTKEWKKCVKKIKKLCTNAKYLIQYVMQRQLDRPKLTYLRLNPILW